MPISAAPGEASKRGKFGWAMFDWANQPFFTLITTFIFAPYFTSFVVGDAVRGQALWGYTQAIAGVVIALLAPFLGSIADASGRRKPWIGVFTAIGVAGSFLLWYATPAADAGVLAFTRVMVVVATIGVEFAIVFNNAMLPSLVPDRRIGLLSGFGWGLGYVGGLVALMIVLLGFSLPEAPLLGLDKAAHEHDRLVGPLSGLWFAVFVIPLFVLTPDGVPSVARFVQVGPWKLGDVDGDGTVGVDDFLAVLGNWGPCAGCDADVDGNGAVGVDDFLAVLANWG